MATERAAGGSRVTSRLPMRMRPPFDASRPAISRSVVDLPQPDGPSRTLSVPASNAKETSSTARTGPSALGHSLLTRSAAIADIGERAMEGGMPESDAHSAEKCGQRRARIRRAHERLAHEKRVHAVAAHLRDIPLRDDSAFR